MATETAKFALELEDGISSSSEAAEESLLSLQTQIDKDAKALTQMKKAMRQMQAAGSVDISAYQKLQGQIESTQNSIGKARASFVNLGGDFTKLGKKRYPKPPDVPTPQGLMDTLATAEGLPGPLGKASQGIGAATAKIQGMTAAAGAVAVAVAAVVAVLVLLVGLLVAVAAATVKATAALLKYAAAQGDALRSERLRLEGLGTLRRWMRLTSKDAGEMSESISRVAETVPLARSQIAGYGQELHRIGIRGRAAESALEALSLAQAVQGDFGRQRLMMLVRMSGHSEKAMARLAHRVRNELGGTAAMAMRSLTMLSTKLKESLQALFADIDLESLLTGLQRLGRLFSQTTESGRALRAILTALLGPLIDELGGLAPAIEYAFKELVILALRGAIALLRLRNTAWQAFGSGVIGRMLRSKGAMETLHVVLISLGVVAVALAIGIVILANTILGALAPILAFSAAVYYGYQSAVRLHTYIMRLAESFGKSAGGWQAAGRNIITGLVKGLRSGVTQLREAITGVANDAMGAFQEALGISSPSRVFARFGLAISQGVAEGVDSGAPEATGAARDMVSATAGNVTNVGGASRSVSVGELHIHVGGEGGEDTARRVTDALRDFFDTGLATEPA